MEVMCATFILLIEDTISLFVSWLLSPFLVKTWKMTEATIPIAMELPIMNPKLFLSFGPMESIFALNPTDDIAFIMSTEYKRRSSLPRKAHAMTKTTIFEAIVAECLKDCCV